MNKYYLSKFGNEQPTDRRKKMDKWNVRKFAPFVPNQNVPFQALLTKLKTLANIITLSKKHAVQEMIPIDCNNQQMGKRVREVDAICVFIFILIEQSIS